MASNRTAILQDIAAHPEEDTPRLIYADWLEEHGDPQGEFIRIQCELAHQERLDPTEPDQTAVERRNQLESRELQLLRQYAKGWAGPWRRIAHGWQFERGLVSQVRLDAADFLSCDQELWMMTPIQGVDLQNAYEHLDALRDASQLSRLRSLGFPFCAIGNDGQPSTRFKIADYSTMDYREIVRRQQAHTRDLAKTRKRNSKRLTQFLQKAALDELRELRLNNNILGNEGVQALCKCRLMNQLQSLDLRVNKLAAESVQQIAESPRFDGLDTLRLAGVENVSHNYESVPGPLAPVVHQLAARLKNLEVAQCGLTLDSFGSQTDVPDCKQLMHLDLTGSYFWRDDMSTGSTFKDFVQSPLLSDLIELNISSSYFDADRISRCFASPRPTLETLILDNSSLGGRGGIALGDMQLPNLRRLSINGQGESPWGEQAPRLTESGADAFFQSNNLPNLAHLSMRMQGLTDTSLESLLDSPLTEQLYYLDLRQNKITDAGAMQLVERGPWDRLAVLNLRQNELSTASKHALRNAFDYRVLI